MAAKTEEVIFSVDCEYAGSTPSIHSLLSIGAVAYQADTENEIGTFYSAIPNQNLVWDNSTLEFWTAPELAKTFRELLDEVYNKTKEGASVKAVAYDFAEWVNLMNDTVYRTVPKKPRPVFVADPIAADWPWINWLFGSTGVENPFGYKGLCLGSMIRQILGVPLYAKVRDHYVNDNPHNALADARAQGKEFFFMREVAKDPKLIKKLREEMGFGNSES